MKHIEYLDYLYMLKTVFFNRLNQKKMSNLWFHHHLCNLICFDMSIVSNYIFPYGMFSNMSELISKSFQLYYIYHLYNYKQNIILYHKNNEYKNNTINHNNIHQIISKDFLFHSYKNNHHQNNNYIRVRNFLNLYLVLLENL